MVPPHRPLGRSRRVVPDTLFPPCIRAHYSLSSCTILCGRDTTGGFKSSSLELIESPETAKQLYVGSPVATTKFTTDLLAGLGASTRKDPQLGPPYRTFRRQISDSRGRSGGVANTEPGHFGSFSAESPRSSVTLEIFGRLVESLGGIFD